MIRLFRFITLLIVAATLLHSCFKDVVTYTDYNIAVYDQSEGNGEITPAMAVAVGQSSARKLLLPVNQCSNIVVGTQTLSLSKLMDEAVELLRSMI